MTAKYNFTKHRKKFFVVSIALLVVILVGALVRGVALDIQFRGGAMLELGYEGTPDMQGVQSLITDKFGSGLTFQQGSNMATGEQSFTVSMPGVETITTEELEMMLNELNDQYPNNHFAQLQMNNVPPTMGREFLAKSLTGVVAACVLILAYIAIRFRKIGGLPAGVMAIIALINDLLVVFGAFVLLGIPLNGNFIAAMLTILGYSINDTVVMYDRIRENESIYGKRMAFEPLVNLSINQSVRRSVNTTVTTCMALAVVCVVSSVFGLNSIFTFALPLMIGMASGLYTSLFITTSLWIEWENFKKKHPKKKKA